MAREVRQFEVIVPAGTTVAVPQVSSLAMPTRIVRHVTVRIPPGPRGEVGWALGAAGVAVLPWNSGEWIVGDDERIGWDLEGQIDSGAWQIIAYNTGAYDHALYVTFLLDLVTAGEASAAAQPLSAASVVTAAVAATPAPSAPAEAVTLPPTSEPLPASGTTATVAPTPTTATVAAPGTSETVAAAVVPTLDQLVAAKFPSLDLYMRSALIAWCASYSDVLRRIATTPATANTPEAQGAPTPCQEAQQTYELLALYVAGKVSGQPPYPARRGQEASTVLQSLLSGKGLPSPPDICRA